MPGNVTDRPLPTSLRVVGLGGNALNTDPGSLEISGLDKACKALAQFAGEGLVITHGNGPQIGMLARTEGDDLPLDVLGAETEGWLGYLIEQELTNCLSPPQQAVSLLTRIEVSGDDPAFGHPSKPIGSWLSAEVAEQLAASHGWQFIERDNQFRRVVPSPAPQRVLQIDAIRSLLRDNHVVICAGGGGIPVTRSDDRKLHGVEAVIDKDLASALLAQQLQAQFLVLATNVPGIYRNWGTDEQTLIDRISTSRLAGMELAAGSMGPKAEAACQFVKATGNNAVIGCLDDLSLLLTGDAGTLVVP